jgi:hypothetical protein
MLDLVLPLKIIFLKSEVKAKLSMPKENSAMKPVWKISSGKTDGSPTENQSAVDDLNERFILGFLS